MVGYWRSKEEFRSQELSIIPNNHQLVVKTASHKALSSTLALTKKSHLLVWPEC